MVHKLWILRLFPVFQSPRSWNAPFCTGFYTSCSPLQQHSILIAWAPRLGTLNLSKFTLRVGWRHYVQLLNNGFSMVSKANPARVINIFNTFYPHLQLPWRSYMPDIEFTNSAKVSSTLITLTKKGWTNEKSFIFKKNFLKWFVCPKN